LACKHQLSISGCSVGVMASGMQEVQRSLARRSAGASGSGYVPAGYNKLIPVPAKKIYAR